MPNAKRQTPNAKRALPVTEQTQGDCMRLSLPNAPAWRTPAHKKTAVRREVRKNCHRKTRHHSCSAPTQYQLLHINCHRYCQKARSAPVSIAPGRKIQYPHGIKKTESDIGKPEKQSPSATHLTAKPRYWRRPTAALGKRGRNTRTHRHAMPAEHNQNQQVK